MVFLMNLISLEFNFVDFAFVTLLQWHFQNVHVVFNADVCAFLSILMSVNFVETVLYAKFVK